MPLTPFPRPYAGAIAPFPLFLYPFALAIFDGLFKFGKRLHSIVKSAGEGPKDHFRKPTTFQLLIEFLSACASGTHFAQHGLKDFFLLRANQGKLWDAKPLA
jgi:hypothetical protein